MRRRSRVLRLAMAYGPGDLRTCRLMPHVITSLLGGTEPGLGSGRRMVDRVYIDADGRTYIADPEPAKELSELASEDRSRGRDSGHGRELSRGRRSALIELCGDQREVQVRLEVFLVLSQHGLDGIPLRASKVLETRGCGLGQEEGSDLDGAVPVFLGEGLEESDDRVAGAFEHVLVLSYD